MKFEPTTLFLKNGDPILIREARTQDAEEIIEVVKEYVEESDFIPYIKGEFNPTIEEEINWIQSLNNQPNSLLLFAICDNKIVGNISLNGSQRQMMKHTACIGIGVLKEWRHLGIGSVLFECAIRWAKANPVIERLWLETYSNNEIGLSTYRKFGFEEEGRQTKHIKIAESNYIDNIIMSLNIK